MTSPATAPAKITTTVNRYSGRRYMGCCRHYHRPMDCPELEMAEDLSKGNRRDLGWKYNYLKDPNDTTRVTCNFYGKTTTGGINRTKQHLFGNFRNASKCTKCPQEVRDELKSYMEEKKIRKEVYTDDFSKFEEFDYQDDRGRQDEVQEIIHKKRGGGSLPSGSNKKSVKGKGPMDVFLQKRGELRQTNIKDSCDKEARAMTIQKIARFFYDNGIPFNVARSKSFKEVVEAIGRYGPNLKPPSYHELRVPLLRKEVELTNDIVNKHREEWVNMELPLWRMDGQTENKEL